MRNIHVKVTGDNVNCENYDHMGCCPTKEHGLDNYGTWCESCKQEYRIDVQITSKDFLKRLNRIGG